MTGVLTPGLATSIGSLPHTDPAAAAALVLDRHPGLPAAPQLPRSTGRETMVAQVATGILGVDVAGDGTVSVRDPAVLDPEAPVARGLDPAGSAGLLSFLDAAAGRRAPVKLQLAGPVTLGAALVHAGVPPALAFRVAGRSTAAKARGLVALARARLPGARLVVFVDEPSLVLATRREFPLDPEDAIDLLSATLAALGRSVVTGVHCCADGGWGLAVDAGCQVLSAPATPRLLTVADRLAAHLEHGGWIAWGAVPTTGPVGNDPAPLWRRLASLWRDLARAGCDPDALRRRAIVTPACGLAGHTRAQAAAVLTLASRLGERMRDRQDRASAGA